METYLLLTYLVYVMVAVGLTVWLARMLFRNGALFLEDVFPEQPQLASAVNRLLVVGFYMLNLGWAFLLVRASPPDSRTAAIEVLVVKLGQLLASLGVIHFANLSVFQLMRHRHQAAQRPPAPPPAPFGYAYVPVPPVQPAQPAQPR